MRQIFSYCLILVIFVSCTKESDTKVDIYLLKSFTKTIDQTTNPVTVSISNAVLDDKPFVANSNIKFYAKSTTTFKLKEDIKPIIKDYGAEKAFAVVVDNEPIYYGTFHPAYLSSILFGIATIDPILISNNELQIQYATSEGNSYLLQLDARNDRRIINSLKKTGRLR